MRVLAILLLLTFSVHAEEANWHLLTQTYGGTITLLKGLTKHECDFAYNRAKHLPATEDEKEGAKRLAQKQKDEKEKYLAEHPKEKETILEAVASATSYMITSGDIKTAECFQ
jgi:hypothetical protein